MKEQIEKLLYTLLSEDWAILLQQHPTFSHEIWHIKNYLEQKKLHPPDIAYSALIILEIINLHQNQVMLETQQRKEYVFHVECSDTKFPDYFDILNLYYKWHKEEFFTILHNQGLSDLRLGESFVYLFIISLTNINIIQKNLASYSLGDYAIWIKVLTKSYQELNYKNGWSFIEQEQSYNSWNFNCNDFPKPKTYYEATEQLLDHRMTLIARDMHVKRKGANQKFLKEYSKSYNFAIEHHDKNPNSILPKIAKEIYQILKANDFFGEKRISENRGLRTVSDWLKDYRLGVDKRAPYYSLSTKTVIEKINALNTKT